MSNKNINKSGVMHLPESPHYKGPPREIPQMKDGCSGSLPQTEPNKPESYLEMLRVYFSDTTKTCSISINCFGDRFCFFFPRDFSWISEGVAQKIVDYLTTPKD